MVKTEYLTAPPPLTQAEIDEIECRERKHPLGSEAEEIRLLQDKIQYLLASPEEARRIEKEWQAEIARLEAYVDWLQAESRAAAGGRSRCQAVDSGASRPGASGPPRAGV